MQQIYQNLYGNIDITFGQPRTETPPMLAFATPLTIQNCDNWVLYQLSQLSKEV